jgi:hypothetical protein
MRINLNQTFKDLKDKPIRQDAKYNKLFTLRDACELAILTEFDDEVIIPGEKWRRYKLARKFEEAGEIIELKSEDITMLKQAIAKVFKGCLIPGQAWEMLDPGTKE